MKNLEHETLLQRFNNKSNCSSKEKLKVSRINKNMNSLSNSNNKKKIEPNVEEIDDECDDESQYSIEDPEKKYQNSSNEDLIYKVDKLIGKRIRKGKVFYKVKWEGFPLSDATWEPVCNLQDPQLIIDYENEQKKLQNKKIKNNINHNSNNNNKKHSNKDENYMDKFVNSNNTNNKNPGNKNANKNKGKTEPKNAKNESSIKEEISSNTKSDSSSKNCNMNEGEIPAGDINSDIPDKILSAKQNYNNPKDLLCLIRWKKRKNGFQPLNSYYKSYLIKEKYPLILLNFLEDNLQSCKKPSNNNNINSQRQKSKSCSRSNSRSRSRSRSRSKKNK